MRFGYTSQLRAFDSLFWVTKFDSLSKIIVSILIWIRDRGLDAIYFSYMVILIFVAFDTINKLSSVHIAIFEVVVKLFVSTCLRFRFNRYTLGHDLLLNRTDVRIIAQLHERNKPQAHRIV